jgi:hypothetical protein
MQFNRISPIFGQRLLFSGGSAAYTPTGNGLVCVVVLADPPAKRPCSNDINPVYQ